LETSTVSRKGSLIWITGNGDWVYHITGTETVTSDTFTLDYTPPIPPVELIEPTGGTFFNAHDYKYFETTPAGRFLYGLINQGETVRCLDGKLNDVEYDPITRQWNDVGIFFPDSWSGDDGETIYSAWPTTANLPIQFWYNAADSLQFQFDNPYFASLMTADPIITQDGDTFTFEPVGDSLETEGWYYSIDGAAFIYTTDASQTRSFTVSQTITLVVQGTSGDELTSSLNVIVPWYQILEPIGGTWDGLYQYYFMGKTAGGRYAYSLVDDGTTNVVDTTHNVEYDPDDTKWYSAGSGTPVSYEDIDGGGIPSIEPFPTLPNIETQYWYDDGNVLRFQFTNPYYVAVVEPVQRLEPIAGNWEGSFDYYYFETTSEGRYLYGLVPEGSTSRFSGDDQWDVEYDPSDSIFYDVGSSVPYKWGIDANGTGLSDFPTDPNMETHYWYNENGNVDFQFTNPYYVAPPEPGHTYLAFYGRSGTSNGWFYELEVSTTDGLIDYNNPVPLNKITVVGTILGADPRWNNPSCIFDGQYTQPDTETLILEPDEIGVLFYMENSSRIEVQSGSYYQGRFMEQSPTRLHSMQPTKPIGIMSVT